MSVFDRALTLAKTLVDKNSAICVIPFFFTILFSLFFLYLFSSLLTSLSLSLSLSLPLFCLPYRFPLASAPRACLPYCDCPRCWASSTVRPSLASTARASMATVPLASIHGMRLHREHSSPASPSLASTAITSPRSQPASTVHASLVVAILPRPPPHIRKKPLPARKESYIRVSTSSSPLACVRFTVELEKARLSAAVAPFTFG